MGIVFDASMAFRQRSVCPPRPYLHRNWIRAITRAQNQHADSNSKGDDGGERPAKRQRCDSTLLGPNLPTDLDEFILASEEIIFDRKMRIQPTKLVLRNSREAGQVGSLGYTSAEPVLKESITTRARCRVTISSRSAGSALQVLYADSQPCILRTVRDALDAPVEVAIEEMKPFFIDEAKLLGEQDGLEGYSLPFNYIIRVVFESAGSNDWMPAYLADANHDTGAVQNPRKEMRQWTLSAVVRDHTKTVVAPLKISKGLDKDSVTDYAVEVDVRWGTTCYAWERHRTRTRTTTDMTVPISASGATTVAADPVPTVNGFATEECPKLLNGVGSPAVDVQVHSMESPIADEELDGELTPNQRSLRERGGQDYNVKRLFNKALGREARRQQQRRQKGDSKLLDDNWITYRTNGPATFVLDGFTCCVCGARNQAFLQLQAHVLCHPDFDFDFDPDPRNGYFATVTRDHDSPGSLLRPGVYQLGKPLGPLDLDKYVGGDESWITSRLGPLNNMPQRDHLPKEAQPGRKLWNKRKRTVTVPHTKQPLFDPVSKAQLQPGAEVRPVVHNDTWLIQKHRDMIEDFVDLSTHEKQYMEEWDAFMAKRKLASDHYLGREILLFLRAKGSWLVASKGRILEFAKHMSSLVARGLLDDSLLVDILSYVHEARTQKGIRGPTSLNGAVEKPPQKSAGGCGACGLPVMAAMQLFCYGEACSHRLYHDDCMRDVAQVSVDQHPWFCDICQDQAFHTSTSFN